MTGAEIMTGIAIAKAVIELGVKGVEAWQNAANTTYGLTDEERAAIKAACDQAMEARRDAHKRLQETP